MKRNSLLNILAIGSIALVAASAGSVGAVVQPMINAFPDVPASTIRLVTTIPSMTGMVVTFIAGMLAGKKVSFRALMILASICMLLGGVLPVFLTGNIYVVLACRLILGIGTGCFGVRNALIFKSFPVEERANYLGKFTFAGSLCGIILSSLTGVLADISWNLGFCIYFLCLLTLIMVVLFLKEPESGETAVGTKAAAPASQTEKARYSPVIFLMGVFLALATISGYTIILGISTFVTELSIGTAAVAGTVISIFSVGSMIGNFFFGKLYAMLKKYNLPVHALLMVVGFLIIRSGAGIVVIYAGAMLVGIGFGCFMSTILTYAGQIAEPSLLTSSTTIIMTINQIGIVVSAYFITAAGAIFPGSEVAASFVLGAIVMAVIAVISFVFKIYPKAFDVKE